MTMDEKLKIAAQNYASGYTCAQAVFSAYMEEMGIDEETAFRVMEGYGGGFGGMQEVCGALAAATAIISYYYSNGCPGKEANRREVYQKVKEAAEIFRKEYGGVTYRDVLRGKSPEAFQCGMKVKDAVLIINHIVVGGQKMLHHQPR